MRSSKAACALAVSLSVLAAFACSSSSGDAPGGSSGSSGDFGSSGSSGSSGTKPTPKDGAPGCASIGPSRGTTATSVPRDGGTAAWTAPEKALAQDDMKTQAILSETVPSTDELRITGYGFKVPGKARVTGVVVGVRRIATDPGAADDQIQLMSNGAAIGRFKFVAGGWPSSGIGTHNYGSETDTFGATLTGADVSRPDFGVSVSAKLDTGALSSNPEIDVVEITVHYCE